MHLFSDALALYGLRKSGMLQPYRVRFSWASAVEMLTSEIAFRQWREDQEPEVLLGHFGIELFKLDDVMRATRQGREFGLDRRWLVIGREVGLGDPLLLDLGASDGVWVVLATDDPEANPVDPADVTRFEDAVQRANPNSATWWWRPMV